MKIVASLSFQGQIMGADMPPAFAPNIDKPKNSFDVAYHTEDAAKAREVFNTIPAADSKPGG